MADQDRAKELFAEAVDLADDQLASFCEKVQSRESAPVAAIFNQMLADYQAAEAANFLSGPAGESIGDSLAGALGTSTGDASADDATIDQAPGQPADDATIELKQTVREDQPTGDQFTVDFISGDSIAAAKNNGTGVGPLLADDYEIRDELGRGGMGTVYRAYQLSLRKEVAVKIIPTHLIRSPEESARFYIEAEAAARLEHPGIVQVQNVGERNGVHYYTMALVTGGSLARYVDSKNATTWGERLTRQRTAEIMEGVSRAVQYAHDHAVIHRDIKPANIMLDGDGNPKLTDFGLAKLTNTNDHLTMTNQVMGTPSYMAPEQAAGTSHAVSNRTDVYSLGATLYALLAGKAPFSGDTLYSTLQKVKETPPAPLPADVPLDLRTICLKCMEKDPKDRYESADDLADDLRRYLDGYPISARPVGPLRRAIGWSKRNPVEAALVGAVALILVVSSIVSTTLWLQASRNLDQANANARELDSALEDTFVFADEQLVDQPGMFETRRAILENAREYYDRQLEAGQIAPVKVASIRYRLGRIEKALGNFDAASSYFDQAIELQRQVVDEAKGTGEAAENVEALIRLSDMHREHTDLGRAIWSRGHENANDDLLSRGLAMWVKHGQQTCDLRRQATELSKDDPEAQRKYAQSLMNLGYAEVQRLLQADPQDDLSAAESLYNQAQQIRERVVRTHPDPTRVKIDMALGLESLADLRVDRAEQIANDVTLQGELLRQTLEYRIQAIGLLTALPQARQDRQTDWFLATLWQKCARVYSKLDGEQQALHCYRQMHAVADRLLLRDPGLTRHRITAAEASWNVYRLLMRQSVLAEKAQDKDLLKNKALAALQQSQQTLADGVIVNTGDTEPVSRLVKYTEEAANELRNGKLYAQSETVAARAVSLLENLPEQCQREHTRAAHAVLAQILERMQEPPPAEDRTT